MLSDYKFVHDNGKDICLCTYETKSNSYHVHTTLKGHNLPVTVFAYDEKNNYLISGDDNKVIILWDLFDNKVAGKFKQHTAGINGIAILEGNRFASSSKDRTIKIWDYYSSKSIITINKDSGGFSRVYNAVDVFHREELIGVGCDHIITFYDDKGNLLKEFKAIFWVRDVACYKDKLNRVHLAYSSGPKLVLNS
jgi:WD40 repeat protein